MPKKDKNSYTVQAGDSWAKIAGKLYGNQRMFKELMAANPQLKYLRPGQQINLALPKRNEDIFISNSAAQAMGMATSNEVADFYRNNPDAQKYGMTNILRANEAASWNTGMTAQTGAIGTTQFQQTQAAQNEQMRYTRPLPGSTYMDRYDRAAQTARNTAAIQQGFQGANPYQDERYRATNRATGSLSSGDKRYQRVERPVIDMAPRQREQRGFWDFINPTSFFDRLGGGGQLSSLQMGAGLAQQAAPAQQQGTQGQGAPSWFQFNQGPLGPTLGLSPQGAITAAQGATAANVAMGGQPPAGATVRGQTQPQPQQPAAPVDPVRQATQNIENGTANERDYAVMSAVKLQSGQMTAQDWQYLGRVMTPDQLREAQSDYNSTFGLGGAATPGMDISTGGIGNPAGLPQMVGNVYVGPNFDQSKLRGYTNANGTFVAANLAGSYFAPLKPNELAGYRSRRNAGSLQHSGGYPGSGLSVGLYSWRL